MRDAIQKSIHGAGRFNLAGLAAALTSGRRTSWRGRGATPSTSAPARERPWWPGAASLPQSRMYERIAFASGREIYLINADGSGLTQLTHSDSNVYNYQRALSPDGTRVAFARTGDQARNYHY